MRSVVVLVALLACAVMAEPAVTAPAKVEVQTKICGNYCGPSKFELLSGHLVTRVANHFRRLLTMGIAWCNARVIDETACVQNDVWGGPAEYGR